MLIMRTEQAWLDTPRGSKTASRTRPCPQYEIEESYWPPGDSAMAKRCKVHLAPHHFSLSGKPT